MSFQNLISSSCVATVFMVGYVALACFNLYGLMYPLTFVDLTTFPPDSFIKSLWPTKEPMHMKVYLSTKPKFNKDFIINEQEQIDDENEDSSPPTPSSHRHHATLLWQADIDTTSLSKSFLITNCLLESNCHEESDDSYRQAVAWLDEVENSLKDHDGGILSTISAAGQGIESTSILLTLYEKLSKQLWSILSLIWNDDKDEASATDAGILERSTISLPASSPMWSALVSNATLYVHVVVVRQQFRPKSTTAPAQQVSAGIDQAIRAHSLLLGQVDLIKYDAPNHVPQPARHLYKDVVYLMQHYLLQDKSALPPWDMKATKTQQYAAHQAAQTMKQNGVGYPYWKPEVSVKFLMDEDSYPMDIAHVSGMDFVRVQKSPTHPSGIAHIPALYVDEIGLTSEKYIPINQTVTSVPLHITFDRSDVKDAKAASASNTATAGGISPARWRLLSHLSHSIESQKELGFEQSDIDDLRRLIADTNVTLLGITILASALHLLFEFLTFKNEVSFWRNNTDLTGLSVRSLFLDMIGQVIIVLFLIEKDSSLLMIVPSAIGCLIAAWKCERAAGFAFVKLSADDKRKKCAWWNVVPRWFGVELRAVRLEAMEQRTSTVTDENSKDPKKTTKTEKKELSDDLANLQAMSLECDRIATKRLGVVLLPLVLLYAIYSLVYEEHTGWYSWFITSASSAVYALGFVLMTPQLFLNYKLKSVAHLPWRVLIYKSLNTFIDDLFSFIIRMPTMARISCFRDDVVFFVYLYQRWLYPVDTSRPVEGGGDGTENVVTDTKKKQ